ncbi:hypothetical protein OGH69_11555 [Flavobacterium sp. MFBS3-15]|uniref:hypothetical protein n=1 Tax=Flavobacterium sp. MFBS3-15 TaxID=2989816 RepID=UPI0022364955|nr:hypothetical protein [Flavobacterium sp. MFBS3-15]MCW4469605.1 hypothetical protein [Flavobacterium sp. MFBS3-15]
MKRKNKILLGGGFIIFIIAIITLFFFPRDCNDLCNNTIVIIDSEVDVDWEHENSAFICNKANANIFVNLSCVGDVDSQAIFLKDHKKVINYSESRKHIEADHRISFGVGNPIKGDDQISLDNLKAEIKKKHGNWDTDKYDHYLYFDIDSSGKLVIDVLEDYNQDKYCYSIQLFKAVTEKRATIDSNPNPIFQFKKMNILHKDVIVFWITGSQNLYYDFSDNPKLTLSEKLFNTGENIVKSPK